MPLRPMRKSRWMAPRKSSRGCATNLTDLKPGTAVKLIVPERPGRAAVRVKATTGLPFGALALALVLVLWTYAGWHEAAYIAAEVQNRRRSCRWR